MKLKLDVKKIRRLKKARKYTWAEIARLGGLNSRQAVYDLILNKRLSGAEFFARVFRVKPKDLIK